MQHRDIDLVAAIAAAPRPALRRFETGMLDIPDDMTDVEDSRAYLSAAGALGSFGPLWEAAPGLEHVIISGGWFDLGTLALPRARHVEVRSPTLHDGDLEAIAGSSLPAVETLSIWFGTDDDTGGIGTPEELEFLDDEARFPALRHLGLVCTQHTEALLIWLAGSRVLRRLETLDLSGGMLSDYQVGRLALPPAAFAHLRRLDLRWNLMSAGSCARVAGLAPDVATGHQRIHGDATRFNACME